jgi:hypothetical protein
MSWSTIPATTESANTPAFDMANKLTNIGSVGSSPEKPAKFSRLGSMAAYAHDSDDEEDDVGEDDYALHGIAESAKVKPAPRSTVSALRNDSMLQSHAVPDVTHENNDEDEYS